MKKKAAHRPFEVVAESIAKKEHLPIERARAIVAATDRKASPAARKANPRLNNVKGKAK